MDVKTHRAYKFRLKPNRSQEKAMLELADVRRWVFNRCVDTTDLYLHACEIGGVKPEWGLLLGPKSKDGSLRLVNRPPKMLADWLKVWRTHYHVTVGLDANGDRIQMSVRDVGTYDLQEQSLVAFANAWRKYLHDIKTNPSRAGKPKFKRRGESIVFRDAKKRAITIRGDRLKVSGLPAAIRYVPFIRHREIEGDVLSLSFSQVANRWFVSVTCSVEMDEKSPESETAVGVDVGVAKNATTSDGRVFMTADAIGRLREKLAHHQQVLASLKPGSGRHRKRKATIAKLQWKMANARRHVSHQISRELASGNRVIAVEDLAITNMTRSAAGTVEKPGKNVAAKSGLNRAILDQTWGQTFQLLNYKTQEYGGEVIQVNPAYTSQKCSACAHVARENRTQQSIFRCVRCGHTENADVNAAKNIRDTAVEVVRKREIESEDGRKTLAETQLTLLQV